MTSKTIYVYNASFSNYYDLQLGTCDRNVKKTLRWHAVVKIFMWCAPILITWVFVLHLTCIQSHIFQMHDMGPEPWVCYYNSASMVCQWSISDFTTVNLFVVDYQTCQNQQLWNQWSTTRTPPLQQQTKAPGVVVLFLCIKSRRICPRENDCHCQCRGHKPRGWP